MNTQAMLTCSSRQRGTITAEPFGLDSPSLKQHTLCPQSVCHPMIGRKIYWDNLLKEKNTLYPTLQTNTIFSSQQLQVYLLQIIVKITVLCIINVVVAGPYGKVGLI